MREKYRPEYVLIRTLFRQCDSLIVKMKGKRKDTKKCVIKRKIMFEIYKDCFFNDKIILKSQQRFKGDHHVVYTEEVNKIVVSSNDDKRLQTLAKIATNPHGTNAFKVRESEMLMVTKI